MRGVLSQARVGLATIILTVVFACALVPAAFAAEGVQADSTQEAMPPAATDATQSDDSLTAQPAGEDEELQPEASTTLVAPAPAPAVSEEQTPVPDAPVDQAPAPDVPADQVSDSEQPAVPTAQPDSEQSVLPGQITVVVPSDVQTPSEAIVESQEEDEEAYNATHANMYRVYNPYSGEHLYTADLNEAYVLSGQGWRWEGIGWVAPTSSQNPVYRLYNPYSGDHHYTLDANEYNTLPGYGWNQENVAWYATNGPTLTIQGFWLVSDSWSSGTLQRYWIDSTGSIAISRVITPEEGAGYYAYAKSDGAVVRGKYNTGEGHVLVAWDNGEIYQNEGWVVTDAFDGHHERYWFEMTSLGIAGARIDFFVIDGSNYYGRGDTGYVARGKCDTGSYVLIADNDGRLASYAPGWLVTDSLDGGMQRYWFEVVHDDITGARVGMFVVDGANYYGMPGDGYVARNRYVYVERWYHANDDGVLSESNDPETEGMMTRAQGFSSPTNYLVMVDTSACRVGVFSGHEGNWNLERFEACVCGAPGSPTITGTYSTKYHLDSLPKYPNAIHCTNIVGGYFFHSVLNSTNELGQHLSHGCVRLDWPFAEYIQTLPYGSTVNLY